MSVSATVAGHGHGVKSNRLSEKWSSLLVDCSVTVILQNADGRESAHSRGGMQMSDKEETADENAGALLGPGMSGGGVMPVAMPVNALNVGPGEPGPGDKWKFPEEAATKGAALRKPAPAEPPRPNDKG